MTNVKEIPTGKPDVKISEMEGKEVSIDDVSSQKGQFGGKDIIFYTATLSDGRTMSINKIIFELCSKDRSPPTIGTVTKVKSKENRGYAYWTLE